MRERNGHDGSVAVSPACLLRCATSPLSVLLQLLAFCLTCLPADALSTSMRVEVEGSQILVNGKPVRITRRRSSAPRQVPPC